MTIKGLGVLIGIKKIGKWAAIVAGAIAIVLVMSHYIGNCNAEKMDARIESLKAAAEMAEVRANGIKAAAEAKAEAAQQKTDQLFLKLTDLSQELTQPKIKPKRSKPTNSTGGVTQAEYRQLEKEYSALSRAYDELIVTNQVLEKEWIKELSELSQSIRREREAMNEIITATETKYNVLRAHTNNLKEGYDALFSKRKKSPFRLGVGVFLGKSLFPKGGMTFAAGLTFGIDLNIIK